MKAVFYYDSSLQQQKNCCLSFFSLLHGLDLIKEVLSLDDEIHNLAKELYQQKSVLIMGRGYHYATCLEGALVSRHIYSNAGDEGSKNILEKIFNFLTTQGGKKHWV